MVSIVRFAGTNCEFDMQHVYQNLLHIPSAIIWHKDKALPSETKLVVLAGGFSYGDYLRSGAIARFAPIMRAVKEFGQKGGRILGICNGFQILTEAKLLPGALLRNQSLHFISKTIPLRIANTNNAFLRDYERDKTISLPIAHADGRYHIDRAGLERLQEGGQILLRYVENENGSIDSIAGICNREKNIFGLMPHPERACEALSLPYIRAQSLRHASGHHVNYHHASGADVAPSTSHDTSGIATSPQGLAMLESIYKA